MKTSLPPLAPDFVGREYAQVINAIELGGPNQQRTTAAHFFSDLEQIFGDIADGAREGLQSPGSLEHEYLTNSRCRAVETAGSMLFETIRRGWLEEHPEPDWLVEVARDQIVNPRGSEKIRSPGVLWSTLSGFSYLEVRTCTIFVPKPMFPTAFEDPELQRFLWLPEDEVPKGGLEEALAQGWQRSGAICRRLAALMRQPTVSDSERQDDESGIQYGRDQKIVLSTQSETDRKTVKPKRPSLNAVMVDLMQKHRNEVCIEWSISQWQTVLIATWGSKPSKSGIQATHAWRLLMKLRQQNGAELRDHQTARDDRGKRRSKAF